MARTQEEYLQKVKSVHKNFYSYPNLNYTRAHDKIRIECPIHGEFCQSANSHLRGNGCPDCGLLKSAKGKKEFHKSQRPDLSHIEVPEGSKAVPVGTKGDYALVDEEDYERVMQYNWRYSKGYAINNIVGLMHRFIMNPPDDMEVDHKDGNQLDNRKSKLRICSHQQNMFNIKKSKTGTSKYKGVCFSKNIGKWRAYIVINNRQKHIGMFTSEDEAALAYNKVAVELFGTHASLNLV